MTADEMVRTIADRHGYKNDGWGKPTTLSALETMLRELYSLARAERDGEWLLALCPHTGAITLTGEDIKSATKYVGLAIEDARGETAREVIEAAAKECDQIAQMWLKYADDEGERESYKLASVAENCADDVRALASRYAETPTTSCAEEAPTAPTKENK